MLVRTTDTDNYTASQCAFHEQSAIHIFLNETLKVAGKITTVAHRAIVVNAHGRLLRRETAHLL